MSGGAVRFWQVVEVMRWDGSGICNLMASDWGSWLRIGLWVFRVGLACDSSWTVGSGWFFLVHPVA